jgi:hypothetical protein
MLYRLLSGEVEARDVQARQNLTQEQRKATAPYSSENIAAEDAIVMFGSAGPQMSVTPEAQRIDQEYLAAVEAGDMETAQRIIADKAQKSGLPVLDESNVTAYKVRRKPAPQKTENASQIKSAQTFNGIPLDERFDVRKDDIRYSVTPTAEDANEPEKYFPLTVQIFGEKVVATAVEVQSIREIYETVKSQVFDYAQEVSEDATKAARDLFDRIRPTEEGPADISWLKEIDSSTSTPGAVIGALYAYSDKMQDGGRFQQEILDVIELSKYFPQNRSQIFGLPPAPVELFGKPVED